MGAETSAQDVRHTIAVYAAGTGGGIAVATPTALDFATTDPVLTVDQAGTYLMFARVMVKVVYDSGANYVATFKLRRTNNTPADVANSTTNWEDYAFSGSVGVGSMAGYSISLPPVIYTTAGTTDTLTIFGSSDQNIGGVAVYTEASIIAVRIH